MPPWQTRKRTLRYAAFGLALALLAAVGVATIWSVERTAASYDWIQHTYRVIATVQEYRASLRGAEAAARGYRLTGNPAMRQEFAAMSQTIDRNLADLALLTSDLPSQAERVHELRRMTSERLQLSRALLASANSTMAPTQHVANGAGMTARIEAVAAAMLAVEKSLLVERRDRSTLQARLLIAFAGGGTAFAIVLLALLMRGLQTEIRHSRELERQTRQASSGLEQSLAQLARVSHQRGALGRYASLLQSCRDIDEALRLTGHVVSELLPGTGGRCYLLRASQDLAESAIAFGTPAAPSAELLHPPQCWALRRGQPFRIDNVAGGLACAHVDVSAAAPGSWSLCVPLSAQGVALGMLHVTGMATDDPVQAQDVVEGIAEQLGLALVNLQLRDSLRMQSLRDPLTGLFNRRYLDESLQREVMRCQRRKLPLAVLMVDVDHFKAFNDTHGHAAGDAMLAAIGHSLQAATRSEDLACRYGGEEFTVVLVEAAPEDALRRAEQIRASIAATTVQHLKRTLGPCTASIGLAMLPSDGLTPTELLEAADQALYRAKSEGRDRVVAAARPALSELSSSTSRA
jgi:diguanylate cyclase (GGDEF)-like protein